MIELRNYQEQAVGKLYSMFERMLSASAKKVCVFKAPTGSGKTVVVANLLRRLVTEKNNAVSIIWVAPRKLHNQSKDKLEKIYQDQVLQCSNFEDLQDNRIDQDEILFFNWESINKKNNTYTMDNENDRNLSNVIQNTKDEGRKLILVIDESHFAAKGERSSEIIHDMSPDITLEVSATPRLLSHNSFAGLWPVDLDDVIREEMIKKEILVNPKFLDIKVGNQTSDEIVIKQALAKRESLKKGFEREKSNINPLVLVQIPDRKALMENKRDEVVKLLKQHNITEDNGKLAIWLSDEKSDTLPNIEKHDNEVEVLIFKQAISIGWDCPRASILVIFRDYTSSEFTTQTVGRIARMPELKHYPDNPELNDGYIFTNLDKIKLIEEYVKEYVSQYESHRNELLYTSVKLKSIYIKRQRERTRLSGDFVKIFNHDSFSKPLKSAINKTPAKIVKPLISDGRISDIDEAGTIPIKGTIKIPSTKDQIQSRFNDFIRSACRPFAPHDSSHILKTALYQFLEDSLNLRKYSIEAQCVVLDDKNHQRFLDKINEAKERYKSEIIQKMGKSRDIDTTLEWEVPRIVSFSDDIPKEKPKKSIMEPFYSKPLSGPEERFIVRLGTSDRITWWYKNGESEKKYFAVLYTDENGYDRPFYVDFIVRFNDGRMGLFDTKGGQTAGEARFKHDGLYKYMKAENKKGKKLFGGLAVEKDGTWRYYDKKEYHFDENDMSDWMVLDL